MAVPDEYAALLEFTEPWQGIHDATLVLLRELHHPYVGWPQALTDLHARATGDLYYYVEDDRGSDGLTLLSRLYAKVAREAAPAATREDAVRLWLYFLTQLAEYATGRRQERALLPLLAGLRELAAVLEERPAELVAASPHLRRLATVLAGQPRKPTAPALSPTLELLAAALDHVYARWLAAPDPADWHRQIVGRARPPAAVARISRRRIEALRDKLERIRQERTSAGGLPVRRLLALPDDDEIVQATLDATAAIEPVAGKVRWLLQLLQSPELVAVQEEVLRRLGLACVKVLATSDEHEGQREAFVREVFGLLREGASPHRGAVADLIARIGREVCANGDPDLVAVFIDETLATDFEYPEFSGFTSEWGVRVNPAHLQSIRAYLSIVEVDPLLAAPLLAALVIHLRLGGVFITDTDLFQRDISSLLRRPVGPVYVLILHLLRLLPVYFSVIGAEGELREVSTHLDEITERRDAVCHFLRKQCHVECNPRLVELTEEIARYWATGDPSPLRTYLPAEVYDELDPADPSVLELRAAVSRLVGTDPHGVSDLFALDPDELRRRLGALKDVPATAREKTELLVRVGHEIRRKYDLDPGDVVERLRSFGRVDRPLIMRLERALASGDAERALALSLDVLEQLQEVILGEETRRPIENITFKRHIAAGIPSMYGSYREDRFDAAGLTFRLEALVPALLERVIDDEQLAPIATAKLRRVSGWLKLLLRQLRIDGYRAQGLAYYIALLDEALAAPDTTLQQLTNVFQLLSGSIQSTIRSRILDAYERPAQLIVAGMLRRGVLAGTGNEHEDVLRHSEALLRTLISESFGLQRLDLLVGTVLRACDETRQSEAAATSAPAPAPATRPLPAVAGELIALDGPPDESHGILSLGNKGFMLRRLTDLGFRVPRGFVLTTALHRPGLPPLRDELVPHLRDRLRRLEGATGLRFGDPARPLLLSVRSGAPISMPGMLDSYLNVGINPGIVEGVAALRGSAWTAWDAYRRFLQFWGMSHGIQRDSFSELIGEAKRRNGVPKKALLPAGRMRELALTYRELVLDSGVKLVDDPFEQLLTCIGLVQRSWESESAQTYRRELHVADEWRTAVIVQMMVFGNLGPRSGTGVALTRNPAGRSESLQLWGDFVIQDQGDDVVSGLVETFPITESQRLHESRGAVLSLEAEFPRIHERLDGIARQLVETYGMNHQEIEFTFESDDPADLYVLQTRDTVVSASAIVPMFEPSEELDRDRLTMGIGVSGGALCGRIAHTAAEIVAVKERYPGEPIILLRPDTVPDDIPLVLQVDGMLTALGGATSHAALAARRLGKTCVVGCRSFAVDKRRSCSSIGGSQFVAGDLISIDGIDGSIYRGAHPARPVNVMGRS